MAATGSANPIGVGQRVAQIVEGCMAPARTKECFSDKVNHPENGELQQQVQQSRAANPQGRPSSSPDKLQDHGQGNGGGSVSAPGQGRAGARQR